MNRRKLLKSTGVAAASLSMAGCLDNLSGGSGGQDKGDETVDTENPGWFDIDSNVLEEKMGKEVTITRSALFRTSENFGVSFTVKNKSGAPLSDVTVHARLLNKNEEPIDTFETALSEEESIDDLAPNEKWNGELVFEDTDPNVILNNVKTYEIWATAQAEQTATEDGSGGGDSSGNATNGGNSSGGNDSSS
ncbi:twin-arginine translocation signal domain-containing protein [Haladaptatus salinisoli]|uniref:twin-arginine translocation signal domain-containing protein n=1 Tax=Haladaptatus salinisoli TaxID=2884876 RepID=UPI001D0B161A|nr:twin-arginine translocation signal domain-containing protein [Haladaptatus salinisoli]